MKDPMRSQSTTHSAAKSPSIFCEGLAYEVSLAMQPDARILLRTIGAKLTSVALTG
jgi:hypothetical protein